MNKEVHIRLDRTASGGKEASKSMMISRRNALIDAVLNNLVEAQKNMAFAKTVNAIGMILLSRYLLHILKQLDDVCIELGAETDGDRC